MTVPFYKTGPVPLQRLLTRIRLGHDIQLKVARGGDVQTITANYRPCDPRVVKPIYYPYDKPSAAMFAGGVFQDLNLNLVQLYNKVNPALAKYRNINEQCTSPAVIVTHLMQQGVIASKGVVMPSMMLSKINDVPVTTLKEMVTELQKQSKFIKMTFGNEVHCVMSNAELVQNHRQIGVAFSSVQPDVTVIRVNSYDGDDCGCGVAKICDTCGKKGQDKDENKNLLPELMFDESDDESAADDEAMIKEDIEAAAKIDVNPAEVALPDFEE